MFDDATKQNANTNAMTQCSQNADSTSTSANAATQV